MLSVLRGAARELGAYRSASQPGTPTAGGGGGGDASAAALPAAAAPSQAQMLLQIAALHKAFLALSEAFLEEQEARQVERADAVKVRVEGGGPVSSCQFAIMLQATLCPVTPPFF